MGGLGMPNSRFSAADYWKTKAQPWFSALTGAPLPQPAVIVGAPSTEPVLQQVNAQHGFQWLRFAATASLWAVRLDQRHQPAPRNHLFHLGQETLATRLLALTSVIEIGKADLTHGMAGLLEGRRANSAQIR